MAGATNRGGGGGGEGQQGQFAPGPQCKGIPKQCRTCSSKIGLLVCWLTFQSSFFKGLVSLYFQPALLLCVLCC